MKTVIFAILIASFTAGTAIGQTCESRAVGRDGKPLHGAAKNSFVDKCKHAACDSRAVDRNGKPLRGAAKNSFMEKCKKSV